MAKKSPVNSVRHAQKQREQNLLMWLVLRGIALGALAIVALVWFALTPNRGDGGSPQLQVSTDRLDMGKQLLGNTVHASFDVKNVGTGTLTLNVPSSATALEGC